MNFYMYSPGFKYIYFINLTTFTILFLSFIIGKISKIKQISAIIHNEEYFNWDWNHIILKKSIKRKKFRIHVIGFQLLMSRFINLIKQ